METWIYANAQTILKVFISIILIFSIVIIITRISGLRTFAKMSSFDFSSTIAIGSIIAAVIMNSGQSIVKGAVALGGIILFQALFSFAIRKSKFLQSLFTNKPQLLMRNGEILYDNLSKCNIGEHDLIAKLREANVLHFDEVLAVVLESTGDISVLHSSDDTQLMDKILLGVDLENE
ncbi:DUF421 domain-containing protein [Aquimarina addita]|uniref:DUF421 domain-containing protein n=1 Tax=Aquimarina addita TaxID=870485 RepID=A0ABP6UR91_9FLAO